MNILIISILVLFLIPLARNLLFWSFAWQIKEYRFDRFFDFISTPEGQRAFFGPFRLYELFSLAAIIILYIFWPVYIYQILFGLLLIEAIMALYKFFAHKIKYPHLTARLAVTLVATLFLQGLVLAAALFRFPELFPIFLMAILFLCCVFLGLAIFLVSPLTYFLRLRVIRKAIRYRRTFKNTRFIGVTGSYGKTTTKDFLATILSQKFKVGKTPANINSEIGVAQHLFRIPKRLDFFVTEMGAYKKGEISLLGKIADHDIGFLTGINEQHLSLFGRIDNTIAAKSEIIEPLIRNNGSLYINLDSPNCRLVKTPIGLRVITYGIYSTDVEAHSKIQSFSQGSIEFIFTYRDIKQKFQVNLLGQHNILNLTGVIAAAYDLGLRAHDIQKGLNSLELPDDTLHPIALGKAILINDTYNNNPDSILAGCSSLSVFKNIPRAIVIDDILELGRESRQIHERIGRELIAFNFSQVFLVGRNYCHLICKSLARDGFPREKIYDDPKKIKTELQNLLKKKSVILFAGRRAGIYLKKLLLLDQ